MDFMNLNQSAHGDREAGFIHSRMRLNRKVVVGHWSDPEVHDRIGAWMRAARAWHDWQGARFCRFGDNMREVAVTEGDKVAAEMKFGFAINGFGVGDLAAAVGAVTDAQAKTLAGEYEERYQVAPELRKAGERHESLRYGARLELGLRAFLEKGGFKGFTTTFEDLHGLRQLPGLGAPAPDGRRLRLRRRRRLEDGGARARDEGDGRGAPRRHVVHGGLHLPSRARRPSGPGRAHARDLPVDRLDQAVARDSPAGHRRQGGPGSAGLRHAGRGLPSTPA